MQPDTQPVGIFIKEKPFAQQFFQLQQNDRLYIFSDGLQSQLGNQDKGKFKIKRVKELITNIFHLKMQEQKIAIEQSFNLWKQETEQTDDILIIGIKI